MVSLSFSYYCYLFPYYFFQIRSGQLIYVVNLSFNLLVVVLCSNIYTCNCFPLHNTEKKSLLFVMQQLKGIIFNVYGDINVIISTIKPKRLHRIWSIRTYIPINITKWIIISSDNANDWYIVFFKDILCQYALSKNVWKQSSAWFIGFRTADIYILFCFVTHNKSI